MASSDEEILSQDEIDALLHGVDSGAVDTDPVPSRPGEVQQFDLATQDRIVRGRLPTLEMINERFARAFRISLFNMLRRSPELNVVGVENQKYAEYLQTLYVPSNLNMVRVRPLRGTALIVFEPRLVFTLVDNFFGGDGRYQTKIEGREFTPTEMRVVRLLLDKAFTDLIEAWAPVMDIEFEHVQSEMNPHLATIVSPSEVVVVSRFHVELEGGGGQVHVTLPYAMLEPIRELLDAGIQSDRKERDEGWAAALREQIKDAEVDVSSVLLQKRMKLGELVRLKAGDILPIDLPPEVALQVEGIPTFRCQFGNSRGNNALQIKGVIRRDPPAQRTTH
ncbi:flagellar motor switch protein FliM [Spectribacter hydrogenoxidans]|uniref:Flagellar motor switch protein FliM n=1 Tax=Spectribacter hydrogenoxidans TaxID=3075608 RepID=A0ABU3BVQ9_9GAMM|nr:flagellar motor switch protein FliM [Salinisphaera sp. W335]MDT0633376.1 flagellar motor switch protein FliM [Salinisphaera sp. W335]